MIVAWYNLLTYQLDTSDLTLSNNLSTIMDVSVLPGVLDHDYSLINIYLEPIRYKQKPGEIPLFNKARWDAFEEDLTLIGKFLWWTQWSITKRHIG